MFGIVDSVENGKDSTAGIANYRCGQSQGSPQPNLTSRLTDVLHVLPQHHLVENLSSSLADEPIQTVNIIFPAVKSIERVGA